MKSLVWEKCRLHIRLRWREKGKRVGEKERRGGSERGERGWKKREI